MLVAIDPGPHTGIFCASDKGAIRLSLTLNLDEASQQLGITQHRYLWDWLKDHVYPSDEIILEKFEFQKDKRSKEFLNYDAGEYVGVIKLWCDLYRTPLRLQSPSQKDQFWDDDKLKRVGLWKGMDRHARDAARHYLYYVTFTLGDKSWLNKLR